jgi:heat shock protein 1/8
MSNNNIKPSSTVSPISIGIDLGTTFSCVGVFQNHRVDIISDPNGYRTIPSYVSFLDSGDIIIGHQAKRRVQKYPKQTVYDAKRFIGKHFSDPIVQKDIPFMAYDIIQGKNDSIIFSIPINNKIKLFTPEDISAILLRRIKEFASVFLHQSVENAVITVPAYFNDAQRHATKQSGELAGFKVLRIINEPTSASIAYGLNNIQLRKDTTTNILVFDLGGGTFDVSIVSLEEGLFQVLATCGDTHLGGEDFDNIVVEYCIQEFIRVHSLESDIDSITHNSKIMMKLKKQVEEAKKVLSSSLSYELEIDAFYKGHDLDIFITREIFERLIEPLLHTCLQPIQQVLCDTDINKTDIHEIVLVGGSTRIPLLQKIISEEFMNKTLCRSINPDEAVAYGAAVQAAILSNVQSPILHNVLLLDVTPLSIGIKTVGGIMNTIIRRNSTIPIKETQIFSTSIDNQSFVNIEIYEGERMLVSDNHCLGQFTIQGIEPAKRGQPKIEVELLIDSNGIVTVSAKDLHTGHQKSIQIDHSIQRLSNKDIQTQIQESETNKINDQERKCIIEGKYNLEKISYEYMKLLDNTDIISKENIQVIHTIIKDTLELVEHKDITKEMIIQQENKIKNIMDPIIMSLSTSL